MPKAKKIELYGVEPASITYYTFQDAQPTPYWYPKFSLD